MKKLIIFLLALSLCACHRAEDEIEELPDVKNMVFITIDGLRRDHLSVYGYPYETAPFISKLAKRGVIFNNAYTVSNRTTPSHTSMFTGRYPSRHGVLRNGMKLSDQSFSLYKLFERNGIKSKALTATLFLNGAVGFPSDTFFDVQKKADKQVLWQNADSMIQRAKAWVSTLRKSDRFFLWIHFYDLHEWGENTGLPVDEQEAIQANMTEERLNYWIQKQNLDEKVFKDRQDMMYRLANYDQRISYVDKKIKHIFLFLKELGLNNDTSWVITSDHGEGLGNHHYKFHDKNLYQEQIRVPLIGYFAENLSAERRSDLVSTIDLFPSIAEAFSIALPEKKELDGKSFYSSKKSHYVFAEGRTRNNENGGSRKKYAICNGLKKYIHSSKGPAELYDLKQDKYELNNILMDDDSDALIEQLNRITASFNKGKIKDVIELEDPATLIELKSLGYLH